MSGNKEIHRLVEYAKIDNDIVKWFSLMENQSLASRSVENMIVVEIDSDHHDFYESVERMRVSLESFSKQLCTVHS